MFLDLIFLSCAEAPHAFVGAFVLLCKQEGTDVIENLQKCDARSLRREEELELCHRAGAWNEVLPQRSRLAEFCALLEVLCLSGTGDSCPASWRCVGSVQKKLDLKSDFSVLLEALGNQSCSASPGIWF